MLNSNRSIKSRSYNPYRFLLTRIFKYFEINQTEIKMELAYIKKELGITTRMLYGLCGTSQPKKRGRAPTLTRFSSSFDSLIIFDSVTFVTDEPMPPEYTRMLKFGEKNYSLYTNSFLHFGQNVAYWSVQELLNLKLQNSSAELPDQENYMDPCTPKGYSHSLVPSNNSSIVPSSNPENQLVHASGNFSECRSTAFTFLQKEKDQCMYQQCHFGSVFIPKLRGKFLGTENFFFTSQFFELGPAATVSDFMSAGQQFCGADWLGLEKKYSNVKNDILSQYCFSSAYIVALLHDSLGIPLDDNRITYTNDVGNFQVDWALGAFIMHSLSNLEKESSNWISIARKNSLVLLALFIVFSSLAFVAWSIVRWRRLQLKTVYDLEKGRYIITRVKL